jgi:hypothetical protein
MRETVLAARMLALTASMPFTRLLAPWSCDHRPPQHQRCCERAWATEAARRAVWGRAPYPDDDEGPPILVEC